MNNQEKWITWVLLGIIAWELSKVVAATPGASFSSDGSCCGPCASGGRGTQFSIQSPLWIQALNDPNALPFTFEGVT